MSDIQYDQAMTEEELWDKVFTLQSELIELRQRMCKASEALDAAFNIYPTLEFKPEGKFHEAKRVGFGQFLKHASKAVTPDWETDL